ncbi:MAG: YifB family Mg chelatase-like AAA ATPase [Armatimonadetes bacterium]|nr:YifB family Mg chelatase-like AAA ATPase [Armatimonadota bacterium]
MIAKARTATLLGIDALEVTVEAGLSGAAPYFAIVGLPDTAVQESRERVHNAIRSSGFEFPYRRITVNLAPADMRKEGPGLDLPIALAVLAASGQLPLEAFDETMVAGELGLDGLIRSVNGAVSIALLCQDRGIKRLILPEESAPEATVAKDVEVYAVNHLREVTELLNDPGSRTPLAPVDFEEDVRPDYGVDFSDVKGQQQAKRALEISAAGGHNVIMVGAPGSGKTMLARRLPTILPPLTIEEAIEVTRIYSSAGMMDGRRGLIWERPFRAPHHGASNAAIVGGGRVPRPGQVSLAHHGVLFLDEMPQFDRNVLEGLRQPLEDGVVSVARVQASIEFPAEMILIGALNPCPCGYHGDRVKACSCHPEAIRRYRNRISGPLLDRIDMHIEVPRLTQDELTNLKPGEPSEAAAARVKRARKQQRERFKDSKTKVNGRMTPRELRSMCPLTDECMGFLRDVSGKMGLSARVFDRVIKVARTIADLAGDDDIGIEHLSEGVQYRSLDRSL